METITSGVAEQQVQRVLDGHENSAAGRAYFGRCQEMSAGDVDQVKAIAVERLTGGLASGPDKFRRDLLDALGHAVHQVEANRR